MLQKSIEDWVVALMRPLYQERYIETLWNTTDPKFKKNGWILKGGIWSPWFFNMRPVGSSPELFDMLVSAMADLLTEHQDLDLLVAVDMAGINLSGGTATASWKNWKIGLPIAYTRPLPQKVRTPQEAAELFDAMDAGFTDIRHQQLAEVIDLVQGRDVNHEKEQEWRTLILNKLNAIKFEAVDYGEKHYIEGRLHDGMKAGIFDDMATTLGSKLIARMTLFREAIKNGFDITCDKVFYILNRNPDNRQVGQDFVNESDQRLFPAALDVHYLIEFDHHLIDLKSDMVDAEYEVINSFQKNRDQFQDEDVQKEVLAMVA